MNSFSDRITTRKRPLHCEIEKQHNTIRLAITVRTVSTILFLLALPTVKAFTLRYPKKVDSHRATYPSVIISPANYRDFPVERNYETSGLRRTKPLIASIIERATVLSHIPGDEASERQKSDDDSLGTNGESAKNNFQGPLKDEERPRCRVVTYSDSKLPSPSKDVYPPALFETPHILRRLDDLYHAMAHDESRLLSYMKDEKLQDNSAIEDDKLPEYTRNCLEDAGFSLLTKRDLDLCEALNAGYLLRLSVVPDVSDLDEKLAHDFYPEKFDQQGKPFNPEELLFGGRVLVYRRGYSQEVTRGRLLLPKIDYLQASLVQRSASWVKRRLEYFEDISSQAIKKTYRTIVVSISERLGRFTSRKSVSFLSNRWRSSIASDLSEDDENTTNSQFFKLTRYGGSKKQFVTSEDPFDALAPFEECRSDFGSQLPSKESHLDTSFELTIDSTLARPEITCAYDVGTLGPDLSRPPMQVLERATISNLVNLFSRDGRRKLLRTLVSKSEIVEPTYQEVVVVWRPLPDEARRQIAVIRPPKIVYEIADMFDIEGMLPPKPESRETRQEKMPLEIRNFEEVPMANLPAVLPKTKLVFLPADAFVFDFVSVVTFLLVIGSQRFDSPKLDLLAIVSVSLWVLRTVLRYSNKLARYNLLVKTFLTSKISHRNSGALKYLATEAGSQRASRAALVHEWMCRLVKRNVNSIPTRSDLVREGSHQVNDLLLKQDEREIPININAALNDLEDLGLVKFSKDGQRVINIARESSQISRTLKRSWDNIFEGQMGLQDLMGRRENSDGQFFSSSADTIEEFL